MPKILLQIDYPWLRIEIWYKGSQRERSFFHTRLWLPTSDRDFWRFESDFRCFCEVITGKNIVKEIESIMGARAERSSPSWACIPQKSLAIARDFWNTKSLGWTPFHRGAHDGFSIPIITKVRRQELLRQIRVWVCVCESCYNDIVICEYKFLFL